MKKEKTLNELQKRGFKIGDMVCVKGIDGLFRNVYGRIININEYERIEVWETDDFGITDIYRYDIDDLARFKPINTVDDILGFFARLDGELELSQYTPGDISSVVNKHGIERTFKKLLVLSGEKDRSCNFIGKWYENTYDDLYGNERYNEWF